MTRVRAVELRVVRIPLVRPFRTSFGVEDAKECILARVETDGAHGWGECVASPAPGYSAEFNAGALEALRAFLVPALLAAGDVTTDDLDRVLGGVRGNPMAKATLVNAVLDAELRARGVSLAAHLGATADRVACGVSIGIAPTTEQLLEQVAGYLAEGYRRIKLKIEPGLDIAPVHAVRAANPGILLSVDANAAYRLADVDVFRALDDADLLMVEQPLHHEDLVEHARLQALVRTDLCLDESIRSAADAPLLDVHDAARAAGTPVWCGGMLETGVGRATNVALAALPGFTLPGDTSGSRRYFHEDLTEPFEVAPDGTMAVPTGPGIGVEPIPERLAATTVHLERIAR